MSLCLYRVSQKKTLDFCLISQEPRIPTFTDQLTVLRVKGPNAFGLAFCDPKGLSEQLWKINLSFSEAHFILQISQHAEIAENGYSFKIL